MIKKIVLLTILSFQVSVFVIAQPSRWQQKIKYTIDVKMDVLTNKLAGTEKMEYINNSPDTLNKLFLHLYWNAFQPNSSMDVRSRELGKIQISQPSKRSDGLDWDARVKDRISQLQPNEIGYNRVKSLKINGKEQKLIEHETIVEVVLDKTILPKSKTIIDVVFEAQVPVQIRRSGRDNAEGIRYSMSQWYPKMVEYDYQGWNANQYIGREFYGVWGDYDVKINIDKEYMVAASGVLQNPNTIGMGYSEPSLKVRTSTPTLTYNFIANNVHDFVWAADPGYAHLSKQVRKDLTLHVFYKAKDEHVDSSWQGVLWAAEKVLPFMEKKYGKYPYPQYSFIQGGDGGMEYAMATLIKGPSLGTVFHEWMHSWYQHMLGTNESLFGWMDEGFTSFAENEVTDYYQKNWDFVNPNQSILSRDLEKKRRDSIDALNKLPAIQADDYAGYFKLARSPHEEPMTTHADHFNTNYGYGNAAYAKGCVFLSQLGYLVGDSVRNKILIEYYNQWRFKHPNANDFIRVAEKVSELTLQWYKEYWVYSTKTIDYALGSTDTDADGKTMITLKRIGKMPMPLDVLITYKDGSKEMHYIPLNLMLGNKAPEDATPRIIHEEWRWTHPEYQFTTNRKVGEIKSIEIDPTKRMADMNAVNNKLEVPN